MHHIIKEYGEVDVKIYTFIISAPDGGRLENSVRRRNSGLCQE
jgi:hypothetical protein